MLDALGLAAGARAVRAQAVSLRDFRRGAEVLRLDLARLDPGQAYHFVHRADLVRAAAGGGAAMQACRSGSRSA